MKAIEIKGAGDAQVVERPLPKLRDDYILVKVKAVAMNPTDVWHTDSLAPVGTLLGCDYAGIVEEVGPKVNKKFKKGDRVAGFAHGGNSMQTEDGSYAEYIVTKGDIQLKIPDNLSFEQAATLGCGVITVGQGLFQALGLPFPPVEPSDEKKYILIYGGSTATGTLAIQYAKLAGFEVITTCSPRNFELCKSLGASQVFDYSTPNVGEEIHKASGGKIGLVLDCISRSGSTEICAAAIGPEGGHYACLLIVDGFPRDDVKKTFTLGYTAIGETIQKSGDPIPGIPDHFEFMVKFAEVTQKLLDDGKIKPHPARVEEGGLHGVLEGLKLMRDWKVSGAKLVYKLE